MQTAVGPITKGVKSQNRCKCARMLSELVRPGARLVIQRGVEDDSTPGWVGLGMSAGRSGSEGFATMAMVIATCLARRVQTAEGRVADRNAQVTEAAEPFVSMLFHRGHAKRLLRTDPLRAMVVGEFVRGLSMRDVEVLCEKPGLARTSKSTVARICAELHERFEVFCRRSLYDVNLATQSSGQRPSRDGYWLMRSPDSRRPGAYKRSSDWALRAAALIRTSKSRDIWRSTRVTPCTRGSAAEGRGTRR